MREYNVVLVTNGAAFYKKLLYNRIAEKKRFLAIFTVGADPIRNKDFYSGVSLFDTYSYTTKTRFFKAIETFRILLKLNCTQLIICGWASLVNWIFAMFSPKKRNAVFIDSSYLESSTDGMKGWMKRLFLSRISLAYCSGKSHVELMERLGFKGKIVVVHGVGLYRRIPQPKFESRDCVKNFLYVGRFSPEKNLEFLIMHFNKHPELTLNIVGFGPQEESLKSISGPNIVFHGAVPNEILSKIYQENDVFILPSLRETWGIVIEEALNNGLPVLVSDRVGCAADLVDENETGVVFSVEDSTSFDSALKKICDVDYYNYLREKISLRRPELIEQAQVDAYLNNCE